MARIRTIKPEFPQSESMGRVSRDSRLCFILLWTMADDAGRLRGNSRMLASLLYPYDDDAKRLIDRWLDELAKEQCITRYQIDGDNYIQINGWSSHQKIDKPSPSKIPSPNDAPKDDSRGFSNVREDSVADQGRDQGREGTTLLGDHEVVTEVYEVPDCPYQELVNAYHEILPSLPQVETISDQRKSHMRARWRDVCAAEKFTRPAGLDHFRELFRYVSKSPFLMGKGNPKPDTGRVFMADIDFLFAPTKFTKLIEGFYHRGKAA